MEYRYNYSSVESDTFICLFTDNSIIFKSENLLHCEKKYINALRQVDSGQCSIKASPRLKSGAWDTDIITKVSNQLPLSAYSREIHLFSYPNAYFTVKSTTLRMKGSILAKGVVSPFSACELNSSQLLSTRLAL